MKITTPIAITDSIIAFAKEISQIRSSQPAIAGNCRVIKFTLCRIVEEINLKPMNR